ncbi:Palmitoyltransferase zdhhc15, partial [Perkinsus olseni]
MPVSPPSFPSAPATVPDREPARFLPVIFVCTIIFTLWAIYNFVHVLPLLQLDRPAVVHHDVAQKGWIEVIIFNSLFAMLLVCYTLCVVVSPGEVLKMDHHCPWIYNCVGFGNHKYFFLLLLYATVAAHFMWITMIDSTRYAVDEEEPLGRVFLLVFGMVLSSLFALLLTAFFSFHIWLAFKAMTTIEYCEKSTQKLGFSGSIYHRGCYGDFVAVVGPNPLFWLLPIACGRGDGMTFVREDTGKSSSNEDQTRVNNNHEGVDSSPIVDEVHRSPESKRVEKYEADAHDAPESTRGGLEYSYGADRQMPPPGPSPKSPPTQSMRGAMGGPPPPPPMSRMDEMPGHDDYARAPPPPPRRQPYPPQNSHAPYSTQSSDRELPPRDYRARQPESDEPLRRDVLHYIYEQTSNVHQHSEECTAAIMQCLTQLLNALEIGMHKTEGRVIENMSLNAELQHDLMKSLSKLDTVTRYCSDNEAHLVENLSETKSSARFIQQRFEQDGNKLDSIQTHLMQLTRQVQEAPTYNDMKAHNEETISAISSRFASLNSTLQKLGHDVAEVKAQNVTLMSALTSVSERLSWLERADQDRLRRSSATSTPKAVIPTTAPHIRTSGAAAVSSNEVDLLSSNDMSYGAAVDMPLREQRYEDTVKVAPVVEHSRPPPPSTIPRSSGPIEAENAEDSPRHSKDEEAPCQVGQEETE